MMDRRTRTSERSSAMAICNTKGADASSERSSINLFRTCDDDVVVYDSKRDER